MKTSSLIFIPFKFAIATITLFLLLTSFAQAQTDTSTTTAGLSSSGIFDCNSKAGAEAMSSVGTKSTIQSLYVPVSDAGVTLNTGSLVYKECVLDPINTRMRENAAFSHVQLGIKAFNKGADGEPMFIKDYIAKVSERSDKTFLRTFEEGELDTLNPAFKDEVKRAIAEDYKTQTREPNKVLECSYKGDLAKVYAGQPEDIWGAIMAIAEPACNPVGAYNLAQEYIIDNIASDKEEMLFRLNNSNAIKDVQTYNEETGRYETLTPGIIVAENVQQLITSGFRQLENADEIGQMVDALYSGLSTQVVSDTRGLAGVTEGFAGQPSYLDQIGDTLRKNLRDAAVNIALGILKGAKQTEITYFNALNSIALTLTATIGDLRQAEALCWAEVVPKAQVYASANNIQITVATSTQFSQAVINAQITSLASTTITDIRKSETALSLIDHLIEGITNTTSPDAQRVALQQLDSLVAQGALHGEYDAQQAVKRRDEIKPAMENLVEDTVVAWADSADVNVGWCNVNNPAVAQKWVEEWRN